EIRTKFVAEPVVAVAVPAERFDIEISAGEKPSGTNARIDGRVRGVVVVVGVVGLDRNGEPASGVVQLQPLGCIEASAVMTRQPLGRIDCSGTALARTPIDFQRVGAQQRVRGVRLCSETVVDQEVEDVLARSRENTREALYRLAIDERRYVGA